MSDPKFPKYVTQTAPPLAPLGTHDILRDAEALLVLMGKEPLGAVAELANALAVSASSAGLQEIETAAKDVHRLASSRGPVILTGAMRALGEAINRTERMHAA
jgi:hypothetical protein